MLWRRRLEVGGGGLRRRPVGLGEGSGGWSDRADEKMAVTMSCPPNLAAGNPWPRGSAHLAREFTEVCTARLRMCPPVTDVAVVVVSVGPGVNEFKSGDQVVSMLNYSSGGGLAEYAVASTSLTVKRSPEVSAAEGAGLPIAAGTALQALRSIGAKFNGTGKPTNVLITAASGGVGLYAVQLAKLANLHVTATCGAHNMEIVRSLGADEALDYRTPEGASLQSPSGRKYDGVVHCTVGIGWSTFEPLLSSAGKVIDITPNSSTMLTAGLHMVTLRKKRLVPLRLSLNKADLEFVVGLVKEGKLKTVVDSRFPLSDAGKAWEKSIDGHATGKIIVEMEG